MKKQLNGILICMLLIGTIIPTVASINQKESETTISSMDDIDWWPMFQHDPEHTGYSTSTGPNTNNILWIFRDKYEYSMFASASVVDGKVYTASVGVFAQNTSKTKKDNCSGKVYCLDAETGDLIWEYISRYGLHATPAVVDGRVYVCSGLWAYKNESVELIKKGDAFCLDAGDGHLIWEVLDCGYVEGGPVVFDGKMYFAAKYYESKNGKVFCLDTETGDEIWSRFFCTPRAPVAVSDGKVFVGLQEWGDSTTEKLLCLNASTGETIWSWDQGDREEILAAAPTVVDGKLYVATAGYTYGTPDPDGTEHVNGAVYCLDAEKGDLLWKSDIDDTFMWCSPAVAYGNVYVGSAGTVGVGLNTNLFGTFYCLNATDGNLVWKRHRLFDTLVLIWPPTILPGCYSPAIADGKVYFGASGRWSAKMYCLDAFTGETIWKYKRFTFFRTGCFFSPAIANGKVYTGFESMFLGNKAMLFCFGE
jgi:outer membrane protein assembly factor BamB